MVLIYSSEVCGMDNKVEVITGGQENNIQSLKLDFYHSLQQQHSVYTSITGSFYHENQQQLKCSLFFHFPV